MDAWETLRAMVRYFTGIVSCFVVLEEMEEYEGPVEDLPSAVDLIDTIETNFRELIRFSSEGKNFDQAAYTDQLREEMKKAEEAGDTQRLWDYFYEHFELINAVRGLPDSDGLVLRFNRHGLGRWTKLVFDISTLRFFALRFIEEQEEKLVLGYQISPEEADYIEGISDVYDIRLSVEMEATVEFILSNRSDEEVYSIERVPPSSMLQ